MHDFDLPLNLYKLDHSEKERRVLISVKLI